MLDKARDAAARLWSDQRGPTLIEYALMAVLLALACYGAIKALGGAVQGTFEDAADKLGG